MTASAKATKGSVTQVYPESGNMGKVLPEYLSKWTTGKVKSEGVDTIPNSYVKEVKSTEEGKLELTLNTGKKVRNAKVSPFFFSLFFSVILNLSYSPFYYL